MYSPEQKKYCKKKNIFFFFHSSVKTGRVSGTTSQGCLDHVIWVRSPFSPADNQMDFILDSLIAFSFQFHINYKRAMLSSSVWMHTILK